MKDSDFLKTFQREGVDINLLKANQAAIQELEKDTTMDLEKKARAMKRLMEEQARITQGDKIIP